MYKDYNGNLNNLYGKGFTYTKLLEEIDMRNNELDSSIENDIASNLYDIIIYGSVHRGLPYWELIHQYYPKSSIALLCGEDHPYCELGNFVSTEYPLFIRELDYNLYNS